MFANHSHFCSSTKPPKNLSLPVCSSFSFVCLHLLAHVYCLLSACSFILVHLQFFCWSKGRKTGPVLLTKALKKRTRRAVWVFSFYVRRLPFPAVLSKVNHSDMLLLYFHVSKLTSSGQHCRCVVAFIVKQLQTLMKIYQMYFTLHFLTFADSLPHCLAHHLIFPTKGFSDKRPNETHHYLG